MVDEVSSYRKFGGCYFGLISSLDYYKKHNQNCNRVIIIIDGGLLCVA